MASNCVESYYLNIAHTQRIKTLNEKLSDSRKSDSICGAMLYQYRQVLILKNSENSLCNKENERLTKEAKKGVVWRKIALPSLGLNILFILLL